MARFRKRYDEDDYAEDLKWFQSRLKGVPNNYFSGIEITLR